MGGFKVLDTPEGDNIWNNYIKTGKVKGFSVEGNFLMNFSRQKTDEYLLDEIINIIKQITD
jgi:phage head maturation protease